MDIWEYMSIIAGIGTGWVVMALAMASWQDTKDEDSLSTLTGLTIAFYCAYEAAAFWFVWTYTPYIKMWY